jgi:hypothetical protein
MYNWLGAALLCAVVVQGCSCNGGELQNDAGQDDAGVPGTDGGGDDGGVCLATGGSCTSGTECCTGVCESQSDGGHACSAAQVCKDNGGSCTTAQDCCSLKCAGGQCATGLCTQSSGQCTADSECCTNNCVSGVCAPNIGVTCAVAGDPCTAEGVNNGCCSRLCKDFDPGATSDLRCAPSPTCRSAGEPCAEGSDCCTFTCTAGVCDAQPPVGTINCLVVGSSCQGSASCCSNLCADDGTGFVQCQFLGGCRPEAELCRRESDCCNYALPVSAKGTQPVCEIFDAAEGIGRCRQITGGDAPAGELCSGGGNNNTCAPNGDYCRDTIFGVRRCVGECGGQVCGGPVVCRGAGETCLTSDECCSRVCAPAADGGFVCADACLANGLACSTSSDCCNGICNSQGVCGALATPDAGTCAPLGAACSGNGDCCSTLCSAGTCQPPIN